jgi:hypothetical protein
MNFISLLEVDKQDCWFKQDGAMAHTANSTMQMLIEFFGGRIISRNLWLSSIPGCIATGLISLGFFEGERVQKQRAHIRRIKQNTELCISNVTAETLHRAASNTRKRVNECIA